MTSKPASHFSAKPPPRTSARGGGSAGLLAAILLAQALIGGHYISRTAIAEGDSRVFVLWDDAMISMRYARNLAKGDGLVWNPGEPAVQGFTNLGVTLAMASLHAAGAPRESAALGIQLLALLALLGTAALSARLVTDLTANPWAGAGCALAVGLCSPFQIYGLQGSDTPFVALAVIAGVAQLARGWLRHGRWGLGGFLPLLLAVAIRPDASLFVGLATGLILLVPDGRGRAVAAAPIAGLVAVWTALIGFSLSYYGDPLPNTYYLKATGTPRLRMFESGIDQLGFVAPELLPVLVGVVLALALRRSPALAPPESGKPAGRSATPVLALLAASFTAALAYHVWVGGDWIREYGSRHWIQLLPAAFVLAAVGADRVAERLDRLPGIPPAGTAAAALILAALPGACANPAAPAREWYQLDNPTLFWSENQMNFMRSRFLERATRPDTSIAVHWAGVGPYFADRPSLDILGRADRHIAHREVDRFVPGHSKWDWDYVLDERKPDLIDFESRGLRHHPSFRRDYLVLQVGPSAVLFVRRDAVDKLLDPSLRVLPLEAVFPTDAPDATDAH